MKAGKTQTRVSLEVFNSKTKTGEWTMEIPPTYWNGFNAWCTIKDKNGKSYKVIIANYFINN